MRMGVNLTGTIWSSYTGNFQDTTDVAEDVDYIDVEDTKSESKEIDPSTIVWPDHPGEGRKEEGVYNILLLGEEAIGMGSSRGRTDVIVIASMNTKTKELKLTSLMRDTLVQIPGYKDNKLNSAYEKGGLDLLYETIALNFDIRLDGCVKVNFDNFEKIIDKLGGLEITLTAGEAKYLNTTNYISKRENRNVVEGKQLLNGNQVLGYSRVRKRSTITGNNNDYGRTDRHRIVLNAIFDKYKTKSKVELATLMFDLLPMITTDIDSDCFELLLNSFIEMGTTDLSQLRIPVDGAFEDNVKVRGMDVLIPDLQKNVEALHTFIFEDTSTQAAATATNDTTAVTDTASESNKAETTSQN
jgi:LCP family protein required for cell wall assembly